MRKLFFAALAALVSLQLAAQPAVREVVVQVAPDHTDWLYKQGETVKFNVTVLRNSVPVKGIGINYTLSEDMMPPLDSGTMTLGDGTAIINAGTMKKAGFLRCRVTATYEGVKYGGLATAGFDPERIEPVTVLPDDFMQFWDKAKADASKVPMDLKTTLVEELCTEKVDVYNVNMQNFANGARLYGVLCVPKGGGKYPAILKLPGAGVRGYNGDAATAEHGYIVFEIGVNGIPVDMPAGVYWDLYYGGLRNYWNYNLDDRDTYYYKRVYMGCVRAIDFIYALPEFDGEDLITYGGSQGGALSIVTAALDERVTGLVAFYPALCDVTGYLHSRAGGWPHMFKDPVHNTPAKIETAKYYDVVNFARHIDIPGFYSFGYNDIVCPPTSVFSALNVISSPKKIVIAEDTGHWAYPEQRDISLQWIDELLGK